MSDKETRISTILFLEKYLLSGVKRIEPRFYVHIAAITAATIFVSGFRIGVRKDIESRRIQPNHTNRHKKGGATASTSATPPERVKGSVGLHSVHYSPACL